MAAIGLTASAQKDTTVVLTQAGTLADQFPNDSLMQTYTGLTISGPLNGDDIIKLQAMCGGGSSGSSALGNISRLDLSDADIVAGGSSYTTITNGLDDTDLYTEDNVLSQMLLSTCYNLTEVTIPTSVTKVERLPFSGSYQLENILVPESNPYFASKDGVLFDKNLTTVLAYPTGKQDTAYVMPSTVTTVAEGAFQSAHWLTKIDFSPLLSHIGSRAFSYTSIKGIHFPASLTGYESNAFSNCSSLAYFIVAEENPYYTAQDGVLFNKEKSALLRFPPAKTDTTYTIPESVIEIGSYAFERCSALSVINLPSKLEKVGVDAFMKCFSVVELNFPSTLKHLDDRAFEYCSSLKRVTMPSKLEFFGIWVYSDCYSIEEAPLPEGCVDMEGNYYGCSLLKQAVVPSTVTKLGYGSFAGCTGLDSVILPASLQAVGQYVFYGCETLSEIRSFAEVPPTCAGSAFYSAPATAKLFVPEGSVNTYKTDASWSYFDIQGFDATDIANPTHNGNTAVARYGLNGLRINDTKTGIQIVKFADGTTHKMVIK